MGFNEKVHAFIAAKFYVRLTEKFGERGRDAFIHGTQRYAEGRGRRMAQRAIRDGQPLTYETYLRYGEWVNTDEIRSIGQQNKSEVQSTSPDWKTKITGCPWHAQFKEMGLPDAGHEYCKHLDNSICRGFNPYIVYEVPQTLHKSDYCIHIIRDVNLSPDGNYKKLEKYLHSFEYHCAHSYWAYTQVTEAIFLSEGRDVASAVLKDFRDTYGEEMADALMKYKDTNFDVAD